MLVRPQISVLTTVLAVLAPAALQALPPAGDTWTKAEPRGGQWLVLRTGYRNAHTKVLPREAVLEKTLPKTSSFIVTYNGFTPDAEAAFQQAVDIWEQLITSSVPIRIQANWTPLDPGTLGSAGSNGFWSDGVSVFPDALADMLNGGDLGGGDFDIIANFNSDLGVWYLGTDANTPAGQYDLVSVVLHEIAHGLGFSGLMVVDVGLGFWAFTVPAIYAFFTEDSSGTSIVDTGVYPDLSIQLAAVLQSGDVFLSGPMAVAANGGVRPELFAPSQWIQGSSYSHLDESVYPPGTPNSLMTPLLDPAEAIHDPGAITLCLFQDIGWTTNADCAAGPSGLAAAGLIIPGFELNLDDLNSPATLFAVRNLTDSPRDIQIDYYGFTIDGGPLRTDTLTLSAQETFTYSVGFDLTDLEVVDGVARGFVGIHEGAGEADGIEGDFFRIDSINNFSTGDRLVRPATDFCDRQEIRYVDFGGASRFRLLINDPPDTGAAVSYEAYNLGGDMVATGLLLTDDNLIFLEHTELVASEEAFGSVVFDFTASGGGWVSAEYSAFGLFSVELNSGCLDGLSAVE